VTAHAKVVVIGGPTASGKSALADALAQALGGTVINADALQLYKELRVLSARPDDAELQQAPHRLYGVLQAKQGCTAAKWRTMALAAIAAASRRNSLPIVVGGTGLYLKALTDGLSPVPKIPEEIREEIRGQTPGEIYDKLKQKDPVMAARLSPRDTQRVRRALEVVTATGRSLALFQRIRPARAAHEFVEIVLLPDRQTLNDAIDARCARMMNEGAVEEVTALLALALDPSLTAMKAVGVRELTSYIEGHITRGAALNALRTATRQYAKRQMTWFRHQMPRAQAWNAQYSESLFPEILSFIRKRVDPTGSGR
jgi:tRNA dimethylallyltransferase